MKCKARNIRKSIKNCIEPCFLLMALVLLFLAVQAVPGISQENYEIRRIRFKGNKTFSKSELLDHTAMQTFNLFKRIQRRDPVLYSAEFMESDLQRLTIFYQSEGFLHADVALDTLIINHKKQRVNINIKIRENKSVKVDTVKFKLNEPLHHVNPDSLLRKLSKRLLLATGARFRDNGIYEDVGEINTEFFNLGYVYVKTNFDLNLRPQADLVDISYDIFPGQICSFGQTTITGTNNIRERKMRKLLAYNPGDQYSKTKLDKTRSNLYDLQLFRVVSINPQMDWDHQENPIPIRIVIQEIPRWESKFGIGFGTEDRFRAFADVTYRGLFGGTSRLNLYAKHSYLTPYMVSLSWIEPMFFVKKLSLTVNPYIQRQREPGYNNLTFGLNLPVAYTFNDYLKGSLAYYFENVTQYEASEINPEDDKFLYNKSGMALWFAFNNSDPVFSAEKGWSVSLGAKVNGYIFGTQFDYTKLWIDVRKYLRLGKFVVGLRGMIGAIHSSDTTGFIPVEDRFYSGGTNSNRGWARSELGPKRENGTPMGGKSIFEMNVEVRHPLFWRLEIAAFVDVGNVWAQDYHYRFNDLAWAVGGGLRLNTPIGPVRLDLGVPIANEKKSVQFFISIGQAF